MLEINEISSNKPVQSNKKLLEIIRETIKRFASTLPKPYKQTLQPKLAKQPNPLSLDDVKKLLLFNMVRLTIR